MSASTTSEQTPTPNPVLPPLESIVQEALKDVQNVSVANTLASLASMGVTKTSDLSMFLPQDLEDIIKPIPPVPRSRLREALAKCIKQAPQVPPAAAPSPAQANLVTVILSGTPTYEIIKTRIKEMLGPKLQNIKPDKAIEITEFFNTPEDNPLHTIIKNLRIPISRQRTPDFLMFNLPQEAYKQPPMEYCSAISVELPNPAMSETSHKLFEHLRASDNIRTSALFATMIGVSGCGKTRTMYEYLCCRFGLYFVADVQGNGGSTDATVARTTIEDAIGTEFFFRTSHNTISALLLARICVFGICMELRPDMTPYEWLLLQTSLWTEELTQAFRLVATLPSDTSDPVIQGALKLFQEQHHYCLPVFLDEAQIFMHSCVDKFPSKQPGVSRPLFSKICSTFGFFSGMLTILGGTGLGLKDVRELLLSQIGKDRWVDVHFIDFAPFYTVDEVLPYFSPFVGGEDSITKNIRAILSQFYLARRRWVPELLRQMLQCQHAIPLDELVSVSHDSLLQMERNPAAPDTCIRGKLEQLKKLPGAGPLLVQLRELAMGYFYLGSVPADKNESELVQEGFCHLTCISPLEVRIYEYRVAYALHYFFEKQGQPLADKIIDLVGITHKIDPSAAGFVFERFIAPKVVAWLKTSPNLATHPYFDRCRASLPTWSHEAVVHTEEPVVIESSRSTGKSLSEYCLSDSKAVFIPAHLDRHDTVFRLQLPGGSQILAFCQWKFRKSMSKKDINDALSTTVPEKVLTLYSDRKRKRDPHATLDNKYHMNGKYLRILCTFPYEAKDEDLPEVCNDGNTILMVLDKHRARSLMSEREWTNLQLVKF